MIVRAAFFLLPLCLYSGVAAQAIGFYLFCLVLPYFSFRGKILASRFPFVKMGLLMAAAHLLFPLANILNYIQPVPEHLSLIDYLWPDKILSPFESRLSSSVLVTAVFFIFVGISNLAAQGSKLSARQQNSAKPIEIWTSYFLGLFVASVPFFFFCLFQYLTGFDYKSKNHILSADHLLANGHYRIYAFYGHPLTVAGVCLAISVTCWAVFWKMQQLKTLPEGFISQNKTFRNAALLWITFANFWCVYASGGRTAFIANVLLLVAIPVGILGRKKPLAVASSVVSILLMSVIIASQTTMGERLLSIGKALEGKTGDNRIFFWKTYVSMISDRPLLGFGNYWIEHGIRTSYYDALGYVKLTEKFNAHNIYLETLGNVGFIGSVALIATVTTGLILLKKRNARNPISKMFYWAFLAGISANLLHGFTQNTFFDSGVIYIYLGFFALLIWSDISDSHESVF